MRGSPSLQSGEAALQRCGKIEATSEGALAPVRIKPMNIAPLKPLISMRLLDQIDVRVGTIESVHDIEGSDKLVHLRVNFGDHSRSIVTGMKQERADPREIEGRQALFVVNLEPRKMRGVLSEGMLFDIGYADGIRPVLAMPESPVPNGSRVG